LMDMKAPPQSIVGAILRGIEIIIPRGPDQVRPQDRLIVFAAADSVAAVRDYFASA
jgi:trk system potassium uptake protein TrkA